MITIVGPKKLTLPSQLGGDDAIYGLTLVCVSRGLIVHDEGDGTVSISGIKDTSLMTPSVAAMLVSKEADVLGCPVFFEIDDVTTECPFSEPEEGTEAETWETWGTFGESHKPRKIGDKWYRSSSVGVSGEPLPASKWASWISSPPTGAKLLSVDEYREIAASQADEEIGDSGDVPLRTFEIDVDDADGAWSVWFNGMLLDKQITTYQFGSVTGKPRITAPITDEQIAGYVDAFKAANPDYASIEYREIK